LNPLLKLLLILEVAALVVIIVLIGGHALLLAIREKRRLVPTRTAMDALGMATVGGEEARERAIELLRRVRKPLRIQALLDVALVVDGRARINLREVADELGIVHDAKRLLRSRRWWKRVTGARVLMGLGEPPIVDLLDDDDIEVQQVAIAWISESDEPPALDRLVRFAGASTPLLRFVAQDSLLRLGRDAVPALQARLGELAAAKRPRRSQVAEAMALLEVADGMVDPELTDSVLPFLSSRRAQLRASAVGVLASFGGRKNERRAAGALSDADPKVRGSAARALGEMGAWRNGHLVRDLLSDRDPSVRREAAIALGRMGPVGRILLREAAASDRAGANLAAQVLQVQGPIREAVG
jgi:HEAT repeat protein